MDRDGERRDGEEWRKEGWGGMEKEGGMRRDGGGMGRDGERGRDEEGWRGHGVVRSEGGMGNRAHSPELVVAHVLIIACILILTRILVLTHVLVVARVRTWALGVIREPQWPLWLVVFRMRRGLWVMVKGACCRGWWWSPVCGFVVVGARRQSWVVGCSLPSWLVVVYTLWMVVVVCGRLSSLSL